MKRLFFRVFVVALMGVVAAVGGLAWFAHSPVGSRQSPLDFTVEPGSGMRQVARQLTDAGIDTWPAALVLLAPGDAPGQRDDYTNFRNEISNLSQLSGTKTLVEESI